MKNINLNNVVGIYLFSLIILHVLFIIAPTNALFLGTPLYSFQRYFALIGIVLLGIDLITNRYMFKEKYGYLLYGIVGSAAISSILTISYDVKHNLFSIIWMTLTLAIIYTYSLRVENQIFHKKMYTVYKVISVVWLVACIVSITAFLFNTGYFIQLDMHVEGAYIRQGFLEHRLFGIFMAMYTSAMFSAMLLIASVFFYIVHKKKYLLVYATIFLIHVILSGARSAMVSLIITLTLVVIYYFYKKKLSSFKVINRVVYLGIVAIITIGLSYSIFNYSKVALGAIQQLSVFTNNQEPYFELVQKMPKVKQESKEEVPEDNAEVSSEAVLEREDASLENPSNNRISIWKDYLSLYKDIGIFGLSPYNFSKYIQDNHEDLFIVNYVKENMPDKYEKGIVYQPHNSYIYLYVTTGLLGLTLFLTYAILLLRKIFNYLYKDGGNSYINFAIVILIFTVTNMLFDTTVFFNNEATIVIFWLLLGYLVKNIKEISK
ncbi:MAG: O-antigen ligase family protein [Gemella sp.]|nr:O-antigen ligase family protein [Gemella sp.]